MPKGQQRGNKEAKKQKKPPVPAPIQVVPGQAKAAGQKADLPRWPKK